MTTSLNFAKYYVVTININAYLYPNFFIHDVVKDTSSLARDLTMAVVLVRPHPYFFAMLESGTMLLRTFPKLSATDNGMFFSTRS